jgi:hypothetical protein
VQQLKTAFLFMKSAIKATQVIKKIRILEGYTLYSICENQENYRASYFHFRLAWFGLIGLRVHR